MEGAPKNEKMKLTDKELSATEEEVKNLGNKVLKLEEQINSTRGYFLFDPASNVFKPDSDGSLDEWKELESKRQIATEKIIKLLESLESALA